MPRAVSNLLQFVKRNASKTKTKWTRANKPNHRPFKIGDLPVVQIHPKNPRTMIHPPPRPKRRTTTRRPKQCTIPPPWDLKRGTIYPPHGLKRGTIPPRGQEMRTLPIRRKMTLRKWFQIGRQRWERSRQKRMPGLPRKWKRLLHWIADCRALLPPGSSGLGC